MRRKLHQTIRKVGEDLEGFRFNTAVAALMELINELYAYRPVDGDSAQGGVDPAVLSEALEGLVLLMAPFTPHMADELWGRMGKKGTTYEATWPGFDAAVAAEDRVTMVVQVNGKVRGRVEVEAGLPEGEMKRVALEIDNVKRFLDGKTPKKVIVIPKNHVVSIAV